MTLTGITARDVEAVVQRTCGCKQRFDHPWAARVAAGLVRARTGQPICPYRCPFSADRHWHIGPAPSLEAMKRIALAIRARAQGTSHMNTNPTTSGLDPKLTAARRQGLLVLLIAYRHNPAGVRQSSSTTPLDQNGEPIHDRSGRRGELRVSWQTLAWLNSHGYVQRRSGSDEHHELTQSGVELAQAVADQEAAR
jgi:hypothetical protein